MAFLPSLSRKTLSAVLGFSAGIMLAVAAFDLMPEAFAVAGIGWGLLGHAAGTGLLAGTDLLLPHMHFLSSDGESQRFLRTGLLN